MLYQIVGISLLSLAAVMLFLYLCFPKALKAITRFLWGELTPQEMKKFGVLSVTFFFIIGSYWLLRVLKDAIFIKIVGIEYQPIAKMVSLCIIVPLVLVYAQLINMFKKEKLFYVLFPIYGIIFLTIAFFLNHPTIGLTDLVAASPSRIFGWFSYVAIESMGSLLVALFWSFVSSYTAADSAKKGYALIISGAQLGSILGPTLSNAYAKVVGIPLLFALAACGVLCVPIMIKLFMTKIMSKEKDSEVYKRAQAEDKKPKTSIIEGAKLLFTKPYLIGIFSIATFYEVIGTIMDFQMKFLAKHEFTVNGVFNQDAYAGFMGMFGQATNVLALTLALLGTSYLMRRFGLTFCLLLFPIAVGAVLGYVFFSPILMVLFGAVVAIKGLSYALNNPAKEMMYIPTSKDARFKTKSWIDMFGARSAKATGSGINYMFMSTLMVSGTIISLGLVGVWIVAALFVGRTFNKLVKSGKTIG